FASCWRTSGSSPVGDVYTGTFQPDERAAESTPAIVVGCAQTRRAVAPARRARSTCGERSGESAGTVIFAATESLFSENASSSALAPSCPYDESSVISAIFSFFGIRYSAQRNAIPWSVGAIRKTFGRLVASMRPSPPWYVTASGTSASRANCHD